MEYLTAGGGTVTVTTINRGTYTDASHSCSGCGNSGKGLGVADTKKAANQHADACRAIPST